MLSLFRQRLYQIIAGYEDANDADRLRHDPAFQILADQPLGEPLGSQPTLSRWENSPAPRDLLRLQDALLDWFVKICGNKSANGERSCSMSIPPTIPLMDSSSSASLMVAYGQHMYHPLLIFERHTGCLLAARLRPGRVVSHARILPLLLRIVPRLQREFPSVRIQLRADAGFATPLLYEFCEFFGLQYAIGIGNNARLRTYSAAPPASSRQTLSSKRPAATLLFQLSLSRAPLVSSAAHLSTKLNTALPVPTYVSWSPTCPAAAVLFFPSITIAGNVRTASKSSRTVLLPTA